MEAGLIVSSVTTRSAAVRVKPPAKTASRRNAVRSSVSSMSWLQSRVARSAWCRGGAERAPPTRTANMSSSRSASSAVDSTRSRAAASSMASGSPSSRWQMAATAAAFSSVIRNDGQTS